MNHIDTPLANKPDKTDSPLGAHPVGTGIGAIVGGTAAGAVAGSIVGPVGTVIGGAVGAIAGAFAGHNVAEMIDPQAEDAYWRDNFKSRPYAGDSSYDEYGPAYRYGVQSYSDQPGRTFEQAESDLSRDWDGARGPSNLDWERAKHATRDAWNRVSDTVERATPGDSDRDGK
jgi:hypothetical protein